MVSSATIFVEARFEKELSVFQVTQGGDLGSFVRFISDDTFVTQI
jgi:hypothetical protein